MTDIQLYTKLSELSPSLKKEVSDYIDFLVYKSEQQKPTDKKKRVLGKAKGLIEMKDNFDDPIEGFNEYMK